MTAHVCVKCNGGWMQDLEDAAKPILTPMIKGESIDLSPEMQQVVSAWAVKTACAAELPQTHPVIDSSYYIEIGRLQDRPPDGIKIWLAWYAGPNTGAIDQRSYAVGQLIEDGLPRDFLFTFRMGQFCCRVFGAEASDEQEVLHLSLGDWPRAIVSIWPSDGEDKSWPPQLALEDRSFAKFMSFHHSKMKGP